MAYTNIDGYKFDAQVNYGWGLSLNMTGKAPEVSKRIFDTYEHMLYYVNDFNDSCIPGLALKVMEDSDTSKNGVYFVSKIGTKGENDTFANDGVVIKLASEDDSSSQLTSAIEALDVEDTAVDGSYVSQVSQTDGKIAVERVELPTVAEVKSEGQAIVSVKQDKGIVTSVAGDVAAAHVTVSGDVFTADTVEDVLTEIDSAIKAVDAKVASLDVTDSEVVGSYVTSVSQKDGEISSEKKPLVSSANENDMLSADETNGGLTLSNVWDCGTFEYEPTEE